MAQQHRVSRWGLGVGIAVALVIWPAVTLAAVWKTGLFAPDPPGWAWVILVFVVLVVPALGWSPAAELRSAWRTQVDGEGIAQGATRIGWSEITSLTLRGGIAELHAGDRRIRVATYLFEDRDALERTLADHARAAGVEPEIAD